MSFASHSGAGLVIALPVAPPCCERGSQKSEPQSAEYLSMGVLVVVLAVAFVVLAVGWQVLMWRYGRRKARRKAAGSGPVTSTDGLDQDLHREAASGGR